MLIRVCVVGDNDDPRNGFVKDLNRTPHLHYLGVCATAEEALRQEPDVVLVDVHLSSVDAFMCVSSLKVSAPTLPVLMITPYQKQGKYDMVDWTFTSVHAGANGCLLDSLPSIRAVQIVRQVYHKAKRGHWMICMSSRPDYQFAKVTRQMHKIADIVNAPSVVIHHGQDWRTVTIIGKRAKLQ